MFKTLKKYYQFVFRYQKNFGLFLVVLVIASIFEGVQPYFYKLFVDAIPLGDFNLLLKILFFYIGVRVLNLIFEITAYWLGDTVLLPMSRDIRLDVFQKIQDLDFAFHLSKSTGSLISAFKRGDGSVFSFFQILNIHLVGIIVRFAVMLFFFYQIDVLAMILAIIFFGINLTVTKFLVDRNIQARRKFNKVEDEISALIVDNMMNYETVKLFAKEKYELNRLKEQFVGWLKKLWEFANTFRMIDITVGVIGNTGLFLVLLLGLFRFSDGNITAGDYIMMIGFMSAFYFEFFALTFKFRDLAKNQVDIEKYFDTLDKETIVKDPKVILKNPKISGEITFDKVSFSYHEGKKQAVQNINLRIRQGQSVAFVGHSGVGKTTLVKLLLRFFDPEKGVISIDGIDIRKFTKSQLRSFIGVVPQDPILFNNTIAYNISYGSDNVSQDELVAATKMANLYEFIQDLPKGFETDVGERGVKLSGGQKQRLAIARMILSRPKIIIFDEATSQLDSDSERKIQESFWQVTKDKTTIIIAHRLSTVIKADKIVVMENGGIKEQGSHKQLVQQDGLYAHFWRLQSLEG